MTEHIHTFPYFANGKLVCDECIEKEDMHQNECHCICHINLKTQCPKCSKFHRS